MRKDVECTFGIMKGRFRVLKSGVRLHGVEATDRIWMTCCALHNMLLRDDGLHTDWEGGSVSDWQGELGLHSAGDVREHVGDFGTDSTLAGYDTAGMGVGNDVVVNADNTVNNSGVGIQEGTVPTGSEGPRVVRQLDFEFFRGRVIENFDIRWQNNDVQWPKRNANI